MNATRTRAFEIARSALAAQTSDAGLDASHPMVVALSDAIDRIEAAMKAHPGCSVMGESAPAHDSNADRSQPVADGILAAAQSMAQGIGTERAAVRVHVSADPAFSGCFAG